MQASCPKCSHRLVVDDARVPDRPFSVRCPKCHAAVRLPGRGKEASPSGPAPAPPGAPAGQSAPSVSGPPSPEAQLLRELGLSAPDRNRQVLVALSDRGLAGSVSTPLTRAGYTLEVLDTPEEGGRLLEDGLFEVVITNRTVPVPGSTESLYERVNRLGAEARRRIFLVLVGEEFKTGDGVQAFAALADLVVHPKDAESVEGALLNTLAERNRLYQALLEARRRVESSAG